MQSEFCPLPYSQRPFEFLPHLHTQSHTDGGDGGGGDGGRGGDGGGGGGGGGGDGDGGGGDGGCGGDGGGGGDGEGGGGGGGGDKTIGCHEQYLLLPEFSARLQESSSGFVLHTLSVPI